MNMQFPINTGNPDTDRQTLAQLEQQYRQANMTMTASPMPGGGFMVQVSQASAQPQYGQPAQPQYGQPAQPQPGHAAQARYGNPAQAHYGGYAQAQYAGQPQGQHGYGAGAPAADAAAVRPLGQQRVAYLKRVYSLLTGAAFTALAAGWIAINVGPTVTWVGAQGEAIAVPWLVSLMLGNSAIFWGSFLLLVAATFVAGWVSKVRHVNVVALFSVGAIMGIELAPMVFIAIYSAGLGNTLTAHPVRDAGIMTAATFVGITAYIFVARKDFSFLKAALSMGFWVILAGCVLTFFIHSEIFSLAIASAGALFAGGFLLYVTSYIFRNSEMDDPVGDALAILVQLRNLFMFLLRIFMSSRD